MNNSLSNKMEFYFASPLLWPVCVWALSPTIPATYVSNYTKLFSYDVVVCLCLISSRATTLKENILKFTCSLCQVCGTPTACLSLPPFWNHQPTHGNHTDQLQNKSLNLFYLLHQVCYSWQELLIKERVQTMLVDYNQRIWNWNKDQLPDKKRYVA